MFEPRLQTGPPANPTLTLTGTGTSVGVPMIGCDCDVCFSDNPRNRRTRSGVLVRAPLGNFVIDTSPDLHNQLVGQRVDNVTAAIFTHSHADHIMGLDDLRICGFRMDAPVRLFCEEIVENQIRQSFDYAFKTSKKPTHRFALPRFEFTRIDETESFDLLGLTIQPLRLHHGPLPILGFRINDVAFCTDVSKIPRETFERLQGIDTFIVDALRDVPHATHFSVKQALQAAKRTGARRTWLTHISHALEYEATNASLPSGIELGYDGLVVEL
jgi:phosphoribosyl 1,2-cyclic phosphate phosphodiesterase